MEQLIVLLFAARFLFQTSLASIVICLKPAQICCPIGASNWVNAMLLKLVVKTAEVKPQTLTDQTERRLTALHLCTSEPVKLQLTSMYAQNSITYVVKTDEI